MKYTDLTRSPSVSQPAQPVQPAPSPVVAPLPAIAPAAAPVPAPVNVPTVPVGLQWAIVGLLALVILLGVVVAHDHFRQWPHPWPVPVPTPVVGPIRVIVLYESSDPLPAGQIDALHSTSIRAYLDAHCLKDGGQPAYRFWDKDIDASREPPSWQSALATARADTTPVPKVCIFTAHGMVAAPLPADEQGTLELLKKYGG